jgi:hypothetical protein
MLVVGFHGSNTNLPAYIPAKELVDEIEQYNVQRPTTQSHGKAFGLAMENAINSRGEWRRANVKTEKRDPEPGNALLDT